MKAIALGDPFSHREKVAAKRSDEGLLRSSFALPRIRRIPSPAAFGDTRSLWERDAIDPREEK
jgi:hypothetical protein